MFLPAVSSFLDHSLGVRLREEEKTTRDRAPLRLRPSPMAAVSPELLLPPHTFEFPASVCYFVRGTADKKDSKVNSQTPTREKNTGNKE